MGEAKTTTSKTALAKNDVSYKTWFSKNNMIMSWLTNSIETDVGQTFLFYKTAKEIWDAAKEMFSDNENAVEVFEIKSQLLVTARGPQCDPILQHSLPILAKTGHVQRIGMGLC